MPSSLTIGRLYNAIAVASAFTTAIPFAGATSAPPNDSANEGSHARLVTVAQSTRMPWNAIAVDARGRFIVASPKWTGNAGPAVAIARKDGQLAPYPDAQWNSWTPGSGATHAFVSVNAIHESADGNLWVVDTGAPEFGGATVDNGPKIVRIDPRTDTVVRIYAFPKDVIHAHTYIDDIRINGDHAYLTDAGEGAILVLDLNTGAVLRRFDGETFTRARPDDKIVVNGKVVSTADGKPLLVNVDPLELSADGKYFYFAPLAGPMSRIETRYLDDASLSEQQLAQHVTQWFDLPAVGGTAMSEDGSLYFTELADNSLKRRAPDGAVSTIVRDKRLRWVDAPFLDGHGNIYLPVPQIDGAPAFNHGKSTIQFPVSLYKVRLPAGQR
jgi:hypothetical protein